MPIACQLFERLMQAGPVTHRLEALVLLFRKAPKAYALCLRTFLGHRGLLALGVPRGGSVVLGRGREYTIRHIWFLWSPHRTKTMGLSFYHETNERCEVVMVKRDKPGY